MKNRLYEEIIFLIISLALLFIAGFNCSVEIADGGTEAGNAKIAGVIVDKNGEPVENALVTLSEKTDSIFPSPDTDAEYDTSVYTNYMGEYSFNLPDSGMYCILVEKYERFLVFIDSIHVYNKQSIPIPTDTVKAPGTVTGTVFLEDTTGISNKNILVASKELKELQVTVTHGEKFTISDLPEGHYSLFCRAESGDFLPAWVFKVKVSPDSSYDVGKIILKKLSNLLLSSNVMTAEFMGLKDLPVDIEPEYTFSKTPTDVVAKAVVYPKDGYIFVDPYIDGDKVIIKHTENFPSGKEIGVHMDVKFDDGDYASFDFLTDAEKRFTTQ